MENKIESKMFTPNEVDLVTTVMSKQLDNPAKAVVNSESSFVAYALHEIYRELGNKY